MKNRVNTDCTVVKMDVDVTNINLTIKQVEALAVAKTGAYVCVANVHMCMEVFDSPKFANVVNNADLVIPDGKPLSWAQQLLGHEEAAQVRGEDIMHALCAKSGQTSLNIGLYGGNSDELLKTVITKLSSTHPDMNITFAYSPPFRALTEQEDKDVVNQINASNVNVLFVGIGCPKQEIWMAAHKHKLSCVMLGVGAAFDFIAGSQMHAPRWMQNSGLEWLFRLCSEPKRLWKRYLKQNPRFVWHFSKQFTRYKLGR